MKKKRKYVKKMITLDSDIAQELESKRILTGIPVSRQLENSYKEVKKRLGVNGNPRV